MTRVETGMAGQKGGMEKVSDATFIFLGRGLEGFVLRK